MDSRHSRGRGGHWKRGGGGGGGGDSGSSGGGRGRGGHHRGRGRRDYHRGRGRDHGAPADFRRNQDHDDKENIEEEEDNTTFSRRKLESNWDRYEESEKAETSEDIPAQRGTDYHVLLSSAGDSYTQFRLSDEKDWEMDSLAKNQIPALFIDLPALTRSLEELPLHTRLNLETEIVQVAIPVQLPPVTVPHRTDSTVAPGLKAPQVGHDSGLPVSCPGKPVPGTAPSVSAAQPPTDDGDQELDLLLNLQKPVTELSVAESNITIEEAPNNQVTASVEQEKKEHTVDTKDTKPDVEKESKSMRQEVTEDDLEDWLDSMIS